MPSFELEWDGDLWILRMDSEYVDGFSMLDDALDCIKAKCEEYRRANA